MKQQRLPAQIVSLGAALMVLGCSTISQQSQSVEQDDLDDIQSSVRTLIDDRSRWVDPNSGF